MERKTFRPTWDIENFVREHKHMGSLRFSLGLPTTFEDVWRLVDFFKQDLVDREAEFMNAVEKWRALPPPASLC